MLEAVERFSQLGVFALLVVMACDPSAAGTSGTSSSVAGGIGLIPFTIQDGNDIYNGHLDLPSWEKLQTDKDFQANILKTLKEAGILPIKAIVDSSHMDKAIQNTPVPVTDAKGQTTWSLEATNILLDECLQNRKALRCRIVSMDLWTKISEKASTANTSFQYNGEQCKKKIKYLKRSFSDYKLGKQKSFNFTNIMTRIFEEPIDYTSQPSQAHSTDMSTSTQTSNQLENYGTGTYDATYEPEFSDQLNDGYKEQTEINFSEVSTGNSESLDNLFIGQPTAEQGNLDMLRDGFIDVNTDTSAPPNKILGLQSATGDCAAIQSGKNKSGGEAIKRKKGASCDWNINSTKKFVEFLTSKKEVIQNMDNIPQHVFKSLSDHMLLHGYIFNPTACKEKFNHMNEFFTTTILPLGGFMAGVKWPHYEEFCEIHDVPLDFILPLNIPADACETDSTGNPIWKEPAVRLLLAEYETKKVLFDSTKSPVRHTLLFAEIASILNAFEIPVSTKQCQDQMGALKMTFREEFDRLDPKRNTGQPPSTWLYYTRMFEIFQGCPSLDAPYLVSVGKGLLYAVKGQKQTAGATSSRGTRTRPKSSTDETAVKEKTPKKTMTQQEYKEKSVSQRDKMSEEIRKLRESYEHRSQARLEQVNTITQILKDYTGKNKES